MAAKSTLRNMVLCLTLVCLACSGLLGYVYAVTEAPIQEANAKALKLSIGQVLPTGGNLSEALEAELNGTAYEYYALAGDSCVTAFAVKSTTVGFGGPLTIMVGVLPDGTVYNTSVLSHSETPGLGAKCSTDPKFIGQWKGFPAGGKLSVKKDGGDVDAITASTITSRAYTLAVANAVALVRSLSGVCEATTEEECDCCDSTDEAEEPLNVRHSSKFNGGTGNE